MVYFYRKHFLFFVKAVIVITFIMSLSEHVNAQSKLWVACTDSSIYEINIDSCTSKLIGNSGIIFWDIAINPQDSILYGVSLSKLYSIDKTDAHATLIGPTIGTNALNFDSYGNMYAPGGYWEIYRIDPNTGIGTNLGMINHSYTSAGDLTFYKGELYLTCMPNLLVDINLNNVSSSFSIGNFANISNVFGTVTLAKDCKEIMYAFEGRNIHQLDTINLLNSFNKCPNIVPAEIYGAASLTESISTIAVDLGNDTAICEGDSMVLTDLLNSVITDISWQDGSTQDSFIVNSAGTYMLTKEYNSCKFTDTINIAIIYPPNVQMGSDTSICGHESITLSVNDSNSVFLWSNGSVDSFITITAKGSYWVNASNECGRNSDTINVIGCDCKLVVPNAFSPNNDGINDVFIPISKCEFQKYKFQIFSRWGGLLFSTNNPYMGWDGTYKNVQTPNNVYVYLITYTDSNGATKKIRGNFFLVK